MVDIKLILIRGLPGSGKSTLAKMFYDYAIWYETDHYWGSDYNFDITKLKEAHEWCQKSVEDALHNGYSVVVSNTFTTKKELKPYFDMAKKLNIVPTVILCQNQFGNVHNVPEDVLIRMKDRFEYDISELFGE